MQLNVIAKAGSSPIEVADKAFAADFNETLVHQVLVSYMAAGRQGSKKQKTRAEVRGGGRKPWKQKGTGNARAGSIRSPIWRGGGKVFAAVPRDYSVKVNRNMYRAAMRCIVSELVRQERLVVVDEFSMAEPKTKDLIAKLNALQLDDVVIIHDEPSEALALSVRNLPFVELLAVPQVNPLSLIRREKVLATSAAVKRIEESLQ